MGAGMGEGECAGEATRGFCACGFRLPCTTGEACAGAGDPASEPNLMPEGGPPALAVAGGVCLIWTEDLRLCSWTLPLPLGPPLTMVGIAGIAGLMALLPFTGDTEELLPWYAPCDPPTATGGAALDTIVGFVALA